MNITHWKLALLIFAFFALGIALGFHAGWTWRSEEAVDACVEAGGAWHPYNGVCYGPTRYPFS